MAIEIKTANRTFKWVDLKAIKNQIKDFSPVRVAARARENLENSWIKLATNLRATAKTVSSMPANFTANFQESKQQVQAADANKYVELDKKIEANINEFNKTSANFAINSDPRDLTKVVEQLDIMEKLSEEISRLLKKQARMYRNSPLINKVASFEVEQEEIINQPVEPVATVEATPTPTMDSVPSFQSSVSSAPIPVSVEETPVVNEPEPAISETPVVPSESDVSQSFENVVNIINEARKAVAENKQLKLDLTDVTKERDSLKLENVRLTDVNNINGQAMDKLMDQVDDLKKQNGDQANTIANYAKENEDLKNNLEDVQALNSKVANYEKIIAEHENEKKEMEEELKSLRFSASQSVTRIKNLEADLKKLSTDNEKLRNSVINFKNALPQVLDGALQNILGSSVMPDAVINEQPTPEVEQEVVSEGSITR